MEGEITQKDIEKNKWPAALSYVWILFILYWIVDSKFVKFHARQSMTIFIGELIFAILRPSLSFLQNYDVFVSILGLVFLALRIAGFVYGLTGQIKKLPVVGDLAERLPL